MRCSVGILTREGKVEKSKMKYLIVSSLLMASLAISETIGMDPTEDPTEYPTDEPTDEDLKEEELRNKMRKERYFQKPAGVDGDNQSMSVTDMQADVYGKGQAYSQGKLTKEEAEKCINLFDEDKNGTLEWEEWDTMNRAFSDEISKAYELWDEAALDSEVMKSCLSQEKQKKMKERFKKPKPEMTVSKIG